MIYLAITGKGLQNVLETAAATGATVWCGADAMTPQDFDALADSNVTRFTYPLEAASEAVLAGAIETIREHHPAATIWVESRV